jgi:type IV pilus assembly protein PilB
MTFGQVLVKKNIITNNLLLQGKKEAEESGFSLEEVLLKKGVSEKDITEAKSEAFGVPIKKILSSTHIPFEILQKIPEESVRYYKFIPLGLKQGVMEMGVVNPDDTEVREALQFLSSKLNLPFKVFLISLSDFRSVLKNYKSLGGEAVKILDELESVIAEKKIPEEVLQKERAITEEAPVTKMVAVILRHAIDGHASDIHIEPLNDKLKVRFRVDGVLHTTLMLPIKVHEAVVARVKILTSMKLDEKRKPQDGRFEARVGGRHIDFRVSTFPTFFGEKVVIRILDPEKGLKKLENTGMTGRNFEAVKRALKRTYGLILLTGPTGSGKTTTLYSMLSMLDREKFNVVSLEDPIEYNLEGVSQSQVRPEINYDFANGLRSILRQDPDMIMVGEIRDKETARLAIQAALTGHLVFSTLHTNNAVGVIPRLIDMGVDPFLIPATLVLAIAQRLVRTLCPESQKPLPVTGAVKKTLENEMKDMAPIIKEKIEMPKEIYRSAPSSACPRGTRGRIGVFEVLKMTPELEKLILTNASEFAIIKEAKNQGMLTMREDGVLKVLDGKIGLEELKEVI